VAVISHFGWLAKEELRQVKAELASMLAAKVGCSGCSSLEMEMRDQALQTPAWNRKRGTQISNYKSVGV
jgi:hypothetical protein